jgi:hypothetical protein
MTCALGLNTRLLEEIGRETGRFYLQNAAPPASFDFW